ncbi:MAG: hypothetical protein JWL62_611, partial [Hyphomicrobiales bacterium]|nr:hypothetical protein [Hyphomicrobiales bacterium]
GTYRVNRMARETVVTGLIRTQTGTPMKVIIATPLKGSSRVYIDRRKAGDEVFTARCKGHF